VRAGDDIEQFRAFITAKTHFGVLTGPSFGGRTTLSRYIAAKFGYQVIEWEPTIAMLKEKLG
jgi:replication-associated recombination protein RarA